MIGAYKMFKKCILLLLCLYILGGCAAPKAAITDGIAYELYVDSSYLKPNSNYYNIYHIQNQQLSKFGDYKLAFGSGTPTYIRDKVGAHHGTDGHGMYKQGYGQLDDYYIGETFEAYLYVDITNGTPDLMYYEDGVRQSIEVPDNIEFRQMQYRDGFLYLHSLSIKNDAKTNIFYVFKIDTTTKQTELLQYAQPYHENIIPYSGDACQIIIENDALLTYYQYLDEKASNLLNATVCLSYTNGKYVEIPALDASRNVVALVFETEQGFGILETVASLEGLTEEDFFLQLRYFDAQGNQIDFKDIDCSQIISTAKEPVLARSGAQYYDNTLYLSISTYAVKSTYVFEYDIDEQRMSYCDKVSGNAYEGQLVEYKNGIPYSMS